MIKWIESNVISITIMSFFAGTIVILSDAAIDHAIAKYIYLSLFGIAALGTTIQIIWAWIINPIRAYRKKQKL